MAPVYKFTEARNDLSRVTDEVQAGGVAIIERRGFKVLLTSLDEQRELLAGCYSFHPEVLVADDGSFSIWLPELAIYGQGDTLEAAEDDLASAALEYVGDWFDVLHRAPNHAGNRGFVWRLAMADDVAAAHRVLFGE
jgi:hypothetical protein